MSSDYVTLFMALVMGYEARNSLELGEGLVAFMRTVLLALSLMVVLIVPRLNFVGLRLEWLASGIFLIWHGVRNLLSRRHRELHVMPVFLDAAGSWVALMLAGANAAALVPGAVAGMILPFGFGPWPHSLRSLSRPLESVMMCTIGSRALMLGIFGISADHWPILLLAVPGLILWEIVGVGQARKTPTG